VVRVRKPEQVRQAVQGSRIPERVNGISQMLGLAAEPCFRRTDLQTPRRMTLDSGHGVGSSWSRPVVGACMSPFSWNCDGLLIH
jgi:hypothetical protein